MAWYILYPKSNGKMKRCSLRKTKPVRDARYGFAEGPLATLADVSHRLNWMNVSKERRPIHNGRMI